MTVSAEHPSGIAEPRIPSTSNRTRRPPGPRGRWLSGNFYDFRSDPLNYLTEQSQTFGDVVGLRFGSMPVVVVNHPDLVEQVLVTNNRKVIKHFALRLAKETLGEGLLTSEGEFWRKQRRLVQPAFHRDLVDGYAEAMVDSAESMLARWSDGQRIDVQSEMMQVTLEIAARTLFGGDMRDRALEVSHAMETLMEAFADRTSRLNGRWLTALIRRLLNSRGCNRALDKIEALLQEFIDQRRAQGDDPARTDLLSLLLQARDEDDGTQMTDRQLRHEVITLFLAGHETTAMTLCWATYLIGTHPEVEARLVDELHENLPGDRRIGLDDLARLPYTSAVIDETLRLYSTVWLLGREVVEPFELGGYHLSKGTNIYMSQWVIQRDARFFDDPESFRPTRWIDTDLARTLPRYAYFPFGGGPRICIGNTFALMEAKLLLATIVRRYGLRLDPGFAPKLWPTMTLRPVDGIPVTLEQRLDS